VMNNQAGPSFAIAFDTGALEIRDFNGAVLRSGNASSLATTAPLFVRGRRGDLILVGTRDGLTAMAADDLRPLGRVSISGDSPRGTLLAQDLDGDGVPEVIMATERRHLIAVDASDGKIIWDVADAGDGESLAFADINRDRILDVFVSGRQKFALALSGRDGSVIWKDNESPGLVTNHAGPFDARALVVVQYGSGVLLIAGDPNRSGLRAIAFAGAEIRPTPP
ncbi:MAG: FG-GAP repeat domain-containing protein, partial [Pseudonocardiaceae bacterium]